MKKYVLLACVLATASTSMAQQQIKANSGQGVVASDSTQGIQSAQVEAALNEVNALQRQLKWAKVRGYSAVALGLTAGTLGLSASIISRLSYKGIAAIIPDSGDIIPGNGQAPWLLRVVVKSGDRGVKLLQKTVPFLIGVPTLIAVGHELVVFIVESRNIAIIETALSDAQHKYELALAAMK